MIIGCPSNIADKFSNVNETLFLLESACGFQDLRESFVTDQVLASFTAMGSVYGSMPNCSYQCGVLLSASIGCLASRYGSVEKEKEGQQMKHAELPDLQSQADIFYLAYWWSLYHNFPQTCDQHLNSYIMADFNQQHTLVSTYL
eukprot:TRINITY_DN22906_c1_g1_i1.p1 TRINITY_DN22906_c1_g1~~TRINITY_DN22906_c1_g1_i1.p1  ORF type:complete len:144 (-),score=14.60 TRINITY_DN22906_c1_g1_i1:135-566(-)